MQLGIVRTHHCAIITDQFFARVTEVSKWLMVQEAIQFSFRIHVVLTLATQAWKAPHHATILGQVAH